MIVIEFIQSPDEEILSEYERHQRIITIGQSYNNNIIISDPSIGTDVLSLSTDINGIWVENNDSTKHYLSNDKKISGKKLHQINDKITLGETTFQIIKFEHLHENDPITEFKKIKQEQLRNDPNLEKQLDKIERELKKITIQHMGHE